MQVSIQVPENESHKPLNTILVNKDLIIDQQSSEVMPVQLIKALDFINCGNFGSYCVNLKTSVFYQVVISFPLVNNYVYIQALDNSMENHHPEQRQINEEHDKFIWTLNNMRDNISRLAPLSTLVVGT